MVETMVTSEQAGELRVQIELAITMADRLGLTLVAAWLEHAVHEIRGADDMT